MTIGARKFALGVLAVVALFVIAMWAPGVTAGIRRACIEAIVTSIGITTVGVGAENFFKAKYGKGQEAPAQGAGQ